jgi:hypothetical protein
VLSRSLRFRDATKYKERLVEHVSEYPPRPFENVPDENAPRELIMDYCSRHFPQYLCPAGPGLTLQAARWLVFLHGICNRPSKWCREFHNLGRRHSAWRIAYTILKGEGIDISHLLATNVYGDPPGWVFQPPANIALAPERIPKTPEALEAILESVIKNIRGKKDDKVPSSILTGPTTCLTYLQSHSTFAIPKHFDPTTGEHSHQIVYDARHASGRTVYTSNDIVIKRNPSGGLTMILLQPCERDRALGDQLNRAFNTLLPGRKTFQTSAVDYTDVTDLRHCMRRYGPSARVGWIDCSSAYNHGKCSPLFQMMTGFTLANMHFRISSYSFGSSQSCLAFQSLSSVVTLLCKALNPSLFCGAQGIITNYIGGG